MSALHRLVGSALVFVFVSACTSEAPPAQSSATVAATRSAAVAREIPPQYGFPADELKLLRHLDSINFIEMRKHAWALWAGLTHQDDPDGTAVFETWYPADDVFAKEPNEHDRDRKYQRGFEPLNQHRFEVAGPGESHISHVLYNKAARDHIRDNKLYLRKTITELNAGFDSKDTKPWNRTITPFPREAIAIKAVWWPIKANEATALPVWDGPYLDKNSDGLYPPMVANDWPQAVAVIPKGIEVPKDLSSVTPTKAGQHIRGSVSLDDLYHFEITQAMIDKLDPEQDGFSHIKAGDYAALIAMHVTTREIHSWVWATYWWHDRPDQGPLADDRPETLQTPWAHFLMNTAFSMDTPGAPDTGPHIVYNPYIEGKFLNGVVSNCAACHNRASSPALSDHLCGALPITRGSHDYQPTSPQREGRAKLEFLWSILFRAQPNGNNPSCLSAGL